MKDYSNLSEFYRCHLEISGNSKSCFLQELHLELCTEVGDSKGHPLHCAAASVSVQTDPEPEHNRFLVAWSDISASSNKEQTGHSTVPLPQKENEIHHCIVKITS